MTISSHDSYNSWGSGGSFSSQWKHSTKNHKILDPVWKGKLQVTNADDLLENFRDYNLVVVLTDKSLPYGTPFSLGVEPVKTKTKFIFFIIPDRRVPKGGFYWTWLKNTIIQALKDGEKVGMACMGGHGRSGTIAAVIYGLYMKEMKKKENPIEVIRELIGCDEPVESITQEDFVYEETGFEKPKVRIASDYIASTKFKAKGAAKSSSGSSATVGFIWYDEKGNELNALQFEPQNLKERPFVSAKKSVTGLAYVVDGERKLAIPVEVDNHGYPRNMPSKICSRCSCARGYQLPVHKGSHLKCIVCPELFKIGATKSRKAIEKVQPPMLPAKGGEDLCDNCGEKIKNMNKASFIYLGGTTMQFCNVKCTDEYNKRIGNMPKSQSSLAGCYKEPCDAYIDGAFCDREDSLYSRVIDGKTLFFCSYIHMIKEEGRRHAAKGVGEVIPFRTQKKEESASKEKESQDLPKAQGNA